MTDTFSRAIHSFLHELSEQDDGLKDRIELFGLEELSKGTVSPQKASVISFFLGPMLFARGGTYTEPEHLEFPEDHKMVLDAPNGWYFLVSNLDITGKHVDGEVRPASGQIALVTVMMRIWAVDPATGQATWGGEEVYRSIQLLDGTTAATVLVDADDDSDAIATRVTGAPNVHSGTDTDAVVFPESSFDVKAGPLSYTGEPFQGRSDDGPVGSLFPIESHYDTDEFGFQLRYLAADERRRAIYFDEGYKAFAPLPTMGITYEYYSVAQIPTSGTFTYRGTTYEVDGVSWLDHQWGKKFTRSSPQVEFPAPADFGGWCWTLFQLDNGDAITYDALHAGVGLFDRDLGSKPQHGFGKYVHRDGSPATPLLGTVVLSDYFKSPETGAMYPTHWKIVVQEAHFVETPDTIKPEPLAGGYTIELDVEAIHKDQVAMFGNLNEFYEGGTRITRGVQRFADGREVELSGVGFGEGVGFETHAFLIYRILKWMDEH